MKGRKAKLKFKPTPIGRLLRYRKPLQMVGDKYHGGNWDRRQRLLYEDAMIIKRGGWTDMIYGQAHNDNDRYDKIWQNAAIESYWDNWEWDWERAQLDNAVRDYDKMVETVDAVAA